MLSLSVWRPHLPDSIDGEPLATEISHLFFRSFPYERLPNNVWTSLFLRPEGMLAMLLFYLVSKPIFKVIQRTLITDPKASWFVASIALHNFALTVFSAAVAWNGWPIVYQHFRTYGAFQTYCDPDDTLWTDSGFGAWNFIFYISKFYEFADTWVLIFKGKQPSFLQVYHHTGIAFCMWIGVLSHSPWIKYVTLLNSVIHTLMYTYFLIKTIDPKVEIKAAKHLTMAQITQFFTGIFVSFPILIMGSECDTASSRFGLVCLQIYGYGLVGLFLAFAKRKYKKTE
eukprot:scaffold5479_cov199-Amphora_coffeaeformis.AAC.43